MHVIVGQVGGKEYSALQIIGAAREAFIGSLPSLDSFAYFILKVFKSTLSFPPSAGIVPLVRCSSFPQPKGFSWKSFQEIVENFMMCVSPFKLKKLEFTCNPFLSSDSLMHLPPNEGIAHFQADFNTIKKNRYLNKQSGFFLHKW